MKARRGNTKIIDVKTEASDADDDFAREMADVVPLAPDPRRRLRATPRITASRASTPPLAKVKEDGGADSVEDSFVAPGVDRRELRKLRRGDHVPGQRLDLHGLTAAKAVASVQGFIDAAHHRDRCVCIVHGRGLHSEGNVAVLKTRVREFLRRSPAVLAYADAPRAAGGSGAVYVLLRK